MKSKSVDKMGLMNNKAVLSQMSFSVSLSALLRVYSHAFRLRGKNSCREVVEALFCCKGRTGLLLMPQKTIYINCL